MASEAIYTGPSMNPTLRAGDALHVCPYGGRPVRVGDVVVYKHPVEGSKIVHRVVESGLRGLITRGDNNTDTDPWPLRPEEIIGRVEWAERDGKTRKIHGGISGRMLGRLLRTIRNLDRGLSRPLHPLYHWLARSGIFLKMVPLLPEMRVLVFRRPGGDEIQLHMGKRIIARHLPGNSRWRIRRPFRLFVDEAVVGARWAGAKDRSRGLK